MSKLFNIYADFGYKIEKGSKVEIELKKRRAARDLDDVVRATFVRFHGYDGTPSTSSIDLKLADGKIYELEIVDIKKYHVLTPPKLYKAPKG